MTFDMNLATFPEQVICVAADDGQVDWQCGRCPNGSKEQYDFRQDWSTFAELGDVMVEHWAHYHRDSP